MDLVFVPGGFLTVMAYRIRHNFLHCVLFCYNLYNLRGLIMGLFCVIVTRYRGYCVTVKSFVFSCGVVIRNWSLFLYKCRLVGCMLCGLMESMLHRVRVRIVVRGWTVLRGTNTKYTSQWWECSFDCAQLLQACCCIENEVFFLHPSLTRLNEFRLILVLASINFLLWWDKYLRWRWSCLRIGSCGKGRTKAKKRKGTGFQRGSIYAVTNLQRLNSLAW
jgi:hypothetical protein